MADGRSLACNLSHASREKEKSGETTESYMMEIICLQVLVMGYEESLHNCRESNIHHFCCLLMLYLQMPHKLLTEEIQSCYIMLSNLRCHE